ncbi:GNAT family N-acetyltransferase [Nocardia sp. XZ_19_385]|uniref:GNAT family N-acetyltransferase n=1 Tax=Nocardia sp. XZ_19_385 TaxID=2769488 RepID=UPI001E5E4184|nr:GNAT family N-acetyltransferase [Nocardia sp. XZ_19_385]
MSSHAPLQITVDDLSGPDIAALLTQHLADMYAHSPEDSVHALDLDELRKPEITFWAARDGGTLVGCTALKELDPTHGEIKSMRTATDYTGRGIAATLLTHLISEARARGYARLSLETGTSDFFAPAVRLYQRHSFDFCGPFAGYTEDPHSIFMTLEL